MGGRGREEKWVKERQIVGLDLERGRESLGGFIVSGFEREKTGLGLGI